MESKRYSADQEIFDGFISVARGKVRSLLAEGYVPVDIIPVNEGDYDVRMEKEGAPQGLLISTFGNCRWYDKEDVC